MDSLPLSFGKVVVKSGATARIAATARAVSPVASTSAVRPSPLVPLPAYAAQLPGPSAGSEGRAAEEGEDSSDSEEYSDDEVEDEARTGVSELQRAVRDLPVTHEIVLKEHTKAVSALSIDPSGNRVVSGGYDYDCKMWDFAGMNASHKPFRSFEMTEGHQIHDLAFSTAGDSFLAATGSNQAKLFSRDGKELLEFIKGDVYLRDLKNAAGHTAALSGVAWQPKNANLFLTSSADSTIRIWDINNKRKSKSVIVIKSKERGGRTKVSAAAWSSDGKTIAGATEDGCVHLWSASSNFARPNATVELAHTKGTRTSCVVFSGDGRQLATRGGDGTVKLWDARSLKVPISTAENLPSLNPETNLIFSPDERFLLTGTAGGKAGVLVGTAEQEALAREASGGAKSMGKVVVLAREGLQVERELNISEYSVVRVLWHPSINQILTASTSGAVNVLYSPLTSLKGATLSVSKAPARRHLDDYTHEAARPIMTPHALPLFADDRTGGRGGGKRKRERDRMSAKRGNKTMRPEMPMVGAGKGGRIGTSAMSHVHKGLSKGLNSLAEDPREALLKYADQPAKYTSVWNETQPVPIFEMREDEADADRAKALNEKARLEREERRRRAGL